MSDSTLILPQKELYIVAIHEAGHLVARYLLFGNIDIIEYVSIGPGRGSLGRNKEDNRKKRQEIDYAFEHDDDFFDESRYAFKECCYSIAGGYAEMIKFHYDEFPDEGAFEDWESLDSFLGVYYNDEKIEKLIAEAMQFTKELVTNNMAIIERVADALIAAQGHQINNPELNVLLKGLCISSIR